METTQKYNIGNSQELLKTIPDNSVNLICTDIVRNENEYKEFMNIL